MLLIDYAQTHDGELVSIVSESFPHLKRGAMRDFINIMQKHKYYKDTEWNRTDFIYSFTNGSQIEFFSVDQSEKVKGARRDVLFINEANNITLESFNQLEVRTRKIVWMDWNPVTEFWWYTDIAPIMDHDFLVLTYKDNEALEEAIIKAIEARQGNKNWWRVYGLGLLGDVEGRIYTGWNIIDELPDFPDTPRVWRYGMDFGYTNDPTAIIAVYKYDGGFILDEKVYQYGMTNQEIAQTIKNLDRAVVIADSAEPKSIDEIRLQGINIIAAEKGNDSVKFGIDFIRDQNISVTKRSINLIKEYRNYMWDQDKNERWLNKPVDINDHALDAVRYAIANRREQEWTAPEDVGGVRPFYEGLPG